MRTALSTVKNASFAALLCLLPLAADAAQCPFFGVATTGFGTGTGVCSTSTLAAAVDSTACTLEFSFVPDPFFCGNTYLTQHWLLFGVNAYPAGLPVGGFLPGSRLYVDPLLVLGPFPGGVSTLPLLADASLIGFTFFAQAVPTFITTVSFPIVPEIGFSTGLQVTLL